ALVVMMSGCPGVISIGSVSAPTRILGPCRSPRMPIGWASFFAALRMFRTFFVNSSWSAWEQLRRKTLTPASISSVMVFSLDDAVPRVATTLVLLCNFILTGLALVGRREARGGP